MKLIYTPKTQTLFSPPHVGYILGILPRNATGYGKILRCYRIVGVERGYSFKPQQEEQLFYRIDAAPVGLDLFKDHINSYTVWESEIEDDWGEPASTPKPEPPKPLKSRMELLMEQVI